MQVILTYGIEKKSLFAIFGDILGGGSLGAAVGLVFFLLVGAVGWVSGALYGALGVVSLVLGGALGGLGLGALVHVIRHPNHYNFDFMLIGEVVFVALILSVLLYRSSISLYERMIGGQNGSSGSGDV